MRRSVLLAMVAIACCAPLTRPTAAPARCLFISGTADGLVKTRAVEDSLTSLRDAIDKWKAANGVTGPISQTAEKPAPHPYWRSAVSPELFLPRRRHGLHLHPLLEGRGLPGGLHLRRQAVQVGEGLA
jgi:hypothetical protein